MNRWSSEELTKALDEFNANAVLVAAKFGVDDAAARTYLAMVFLEEAVECKSLLKDLHDSIEFQPDTDLEKRIADLVKDIDYSKALDTIQ